MLWPCVHNDVVQTKGYRQSLYFAVKDSVSGHGHIDVRPQSLIAISSMQIDKVVSLVDYLGGEDVGNALMILPSGSPGNMRFKFLPSPGL